MQIITHNQLKRLILSILLIVCLSVVGLCQELPKNFGKLQVQLFSSEKSNDRLVVAFGGSEGGNTFAEERTADVRQEFFDRGFHFLSIGYFGGRGLPKHLDRISLDAVYDTIRQTSIRLNIPVNEVILLGASRGGELVLNLASNCEFQGVMALVPSSVTVPNLQNKKPTSSWILNNQPVEFIRVDERIVDKKG